MLERLIEWDREILIYLNNLGSEFFDPLWATITSIFTWIPFFIVLFIFLLLKHTKRDVLLMLITVGLLILFILFATDFTKHFFERPRPNNEVAINQLIRIVKNPGTYSFFSGHAASSFAITTLVVLFLRKKMKWTLLFYCWPLLFAYSRIYLGVHYPLDILVGALVGVLSAGLFYMLFQKLIKPYLGSNHPL